jgi:hypothetical protein
VRNEATVICTDRAGAPDHLKVIATALAQVRNEATAICTDRADAPDRLKVIAPALAEVRNEATAICTDRADAPDRLKVIAPAPGGSAKRSHGNLYRSCGRARSPESHRTSPMRKCETKRRQSVPIVRARLIASLSL